MASIKLTGNKAQCTVCERVFSTDSNFDKHRKGVHGVGRYCVNPSEVGLLESESGVWKGAPRDFPKIAKKEAE